MEEFRINNYIVDYETEPYYFKIEEIKRNEQGNLACYYRNGSCWSIAPDKVELTEEILLKCGFIKEKIMTSSFSIGKLTIDIGCDKIHPYGRVYFNSWAIIEKKIEYLHQLQNLYFALTNEELTVNL